MKVISVVGARPNFMKISPFVKAIENHNASGSLPEIQHILVHTGQHYDDNLSNYFFRSLGISEPDINLEIGSGTHAEQVGQTMIAFEKVVREIQPDWVVVVGDVNATCACSITAKKENIWLAHIEAGLRSHDMHMPEEINRLVTDRLSDLLLTPDTISYNNLINEGVKDDKISFVGNIMIDTLDQHREISAQLNITEILKANHHSETRRLEGRISLSNSPGYALMTMHRPSNVDDQKILKSLTEFLMEKVAPILPIIWPMHPRSEMRLKEFGIWNKLQEANNMILLKPIGYHEMIRLNSEARIMLTDSGGLQEECCIFGTPCLTLRWNTERPVTLRKNGGVSVLVGNDTEKIQKELHSALEAGRSPIRPELWDGHTAQRILTKLIQMHDHLSSVSDKTVHNL